MLRCLLVLFVSVVAGACPKKVSENAAKIRPNYDRKTGKESFTADKSSGRNSGLQIYRGDFVHSKNFEEYEKLLDHVIVVQDGLITSVLAATPGNLSILQRDYSLWASDLKRHVDGFRFWLPGFIDTHVHYSQLWNRGLGTDLPLLPWLKQFTFPLEDFFVNSGRMDIPTYRAFVDIAYTRAIQHYLSMGITSAMIYATSDTNSTLRLARLCGHYGQRCFVGKVNMDHDDGRGERYHVYEELEEGYKETVRFLREMEELDCVRSGLVAPVITPRFALACSDEMLKRLGKLASEKNLLIQTHMSENPTEIKEVEERFGKSYPQVYRDAGLLTNRTVLAHCVHMNKTHLDMVMESGATCAHCPTSNFQLGSGIAPISWYKSQGLGRIGLGSDVSGGWAVSMLEVMKSAIMASKSLSFVHGSDPDWEPLTYVNTLFMATIGGAEALKLSSKVGRFEPGYEFDAVLVDPYGDVTSPLDSEMDMDILDVTKHSSVDENLQKFIMTGDNRNIVEVWVKGERAVPFRPPPEWQAPAPPKVPLRERRRQRGTATA
uniref:Guanine deaminase n=1 Tax=Tetraselmis sp. GSL018 TaxID=582737 RepID=A0A061REH3_9CHLO